MTDEKKFYEARPRSGQMSGANMAAVSIAEQGALWLAIQDLAALHGGQPGEWFENLKQRSIREAKASIGEGIPIEAEADAVQFSVDVLEALFNAFRDRLTKASDKN